MDEDPLIFLQNCSKEDIMTFLKWLHDNYRIKKLDSSHEYTRIFLMLYRRCVGHSLLSILVVAFVSGRTGTPVSSF
jgi:hypothetical protein